MMYHKAKENDVDYEDLLSGVIFCHSLREEIVKEIKERYEK